jgi:hypothetical protein
VVTHVGGFSTIVVVSMGIIGLTMLNALSYVYMGVDTLSLELHIIQL